MTIGSSSLHEGGLGQRRVGLQRRGRHGDEGGDGGRSAPTRWLYVFCHYNYLYPCLRSTLQEIAEAYQKLHGREAHESDSI